LYPLDGEAALWLGDRLALLPAQRTGGLGARLVRFAVATAAERGGRQRQAHVQLANVPFFQRLGWRTDGAQECYVGRPHQPMIITW
jgi:predicted N-acetyltransferase YhbS